MGLPDPSDLYDSKIALNKLEDAFPKQEEINKALDIWILRFVEESEEKTDKGTTALTMSPHLPYYIKDCLAAIYHTAFTNVLVERARELERKGFLKSLGPSRFILSDSYRKERKSE